MLKNRNILVIDTECSRSADDCRHCNATQERHALDFRGEYHKYERLGWDNRVALGLSIGCAYSYLTDRCQWFDSHTLEAFIGQCVETQPLLVSFNGIAHDFPLMRGLLRAEAEDMLEKAGPGPGEAAYEARHAAAEHAERLHRRCDAFKSLCATSYDILAEIWKVDPARKFERGLNSLDAISQANGLGAKLSHGAQAPRDWREGQYAKVLNYCQDDVYKTKALFEMVCAGTPMLRGDGQPITLPRPVGLEVPHA